MYLLVCFFFLFLECQWSLIIAYISDSQLRSIWQGLETSDYNLRRRYYWNAVDRGQRCF